jgi:hypothetical protein
MVFYTYNNIGTISIKLWQIGGKGFWQRKINQLVFVYKHATACAKSLCQITLRLQQHSQYIYILQNKLGLNFNISFFFNKKPTFCP